MRLSTEKRKAYMEKNPIAVYGMSNWGGIAIIDVIYGIDNYIVWYDSRIESEKRKIHVSKIYYADENTYFKPYGSKYVKLSECERVSRN